MPKAVSLNPEDAYDPIGDAADRIAAYVADQCEGEIDKIYCQPNNEGLYVAVNGDRTHRFQLTALEPCAEARRDLHEADRTYTVGELLSLNLKSPPAFIEGLLHEGETIVIAGRQKVGKSRLVQQMALCLASGEPFLGMRVPNPVHVLMIDFENRLAPLSQRFRAMGGGSSGHERLRVWCAQSLDSTLPDASPEGAALLQRLVEQVQPDVLIIDPWRLWLGGDENDARDIVNGLKILSSARANLPRLAIVIVHHVRKEKFDSPKRLLQDPSLWADAVSGHHAFSSHVDACYGLERQMDEAEDPLIVFGGIARNSLPPTLILEEDESLRFKVAANEAAALKVMTEAQRDVWAKIKRLRKFGFNQAVTAAETTNRKAVSAALKIAEGHGLLIKVGESYARVGA